MKKPAFALMLFFTLCPISFANMTIDKIKVQTLPEIYQQQQFNDYVEAVKDRIESQPQDIDARVDLFTLYYTKQMWPEAIMVIQEAIKHRPAKFDKDLYGWLADSYFDNKQMDEGKKALDIAIKEFPDDATNYYNLVIYYGIKKDLTQTAQAMRVAAAKDKDSDDVYYNIYQHFIAQKQVDDEELVKIAKIILDQEPNNPKAHRFYAVSLRNARVNDFEKDFLEIKQHLDLALKLDPKFIPMYVTMADTYMLRGLNKKDDHLLQEAIRWIDKAKKTDPQYFRLDYIYANTYACMNNNQKALYHAQKYYQRYPDQPESQEMLGRIYNNYAYDYYQKNINLKKGLGFIEKALALDPENGYYLSTKAELLYKLKRYKEAYAIIQQAHDRLPYAEEINKDLEMIKKVVGK